MELAQTCYSVASGSHGSHAERSNGATHWEDIVAQAFFSLCISSSSKQQFLNRSGRGRHDVSLLETLESLLLLQNTSGTKEAINISFSDFISLSGPVLMASVTLLRCLAAVGLIHILVFIIGWRTWQSNRQEPKNLLSSIHLP